MCSNTHFEHRDFKSLQYFVYINISKSKLFNYNCNIGSNLMQLVITESGVQSLNQIFEVWNASKMRFIDISSNKLMYLHKILMKKFNFVLNKALLARNRISFIGSISF